MTSSVGPSISYTNQRTENTEVYQETAESEDYLSKAEG